MLITFAISSNFNIEIVNKIQSPKDKELITSEVRSCFEKKETITSVQCLNDTTLFATGSIPFKARRGLLNCTDGNISYKLSLTFTSNNYILSFTNFTHKSVLNSNCSMGLIVDTIKAKKLSGFTKRHCAELLKWQNEDIKLEVKSIIDSISKSIHRVKANTPINKDLTKKVSVKGIRNTTWGMNMSDVKSAETALFMEESSSNDLLVFSTIIANKKTSIVYIFVDDILVRMKYIFLEEHTNKNAYLSDYQEFEALLKRKYGQASKENVFWGQDLFKEDRDKRGLAVSLGHLSYYTLWTLNGTSVIHSLTGDNYKINHSIQYSSTKHKKIEDEKIEKEALSDL